MAALLATLVEIKKHLAIKGTGAAADFPTEDDLDTYLQDVMDNTEAILAGTINRTFIVAGTHTDEPHDGTGTEVFYVDHPVDTLTSVKIGIDPSDADETLTSQPDCVDFTGQRVINREGVWPRGVKNLYATYEGLAYLPEIAKQALYEGVAFLYRRRGKEHVSSQTIGEFGSIEAAALFSKLPAWRMAKKILRIPAAV